MQVYRTAVTLMVIVIVSPSAVAGQMQCESPDFSSILLAEVYYNALVANEYLAILNQGSGSMDLSGWTISDLEGTVAFPLGTMVTAGQEVVVAQNSTLYSRDTLDRADFQYAGGLAPAMIRKGGTFVLNNQGDEVLLADADGTIIDAFVYGTSSYSGTGWDGGPATALPKGHVAVRAQYHGLFQDTDSSSDWDTLRSRVLGQSSFTPVEFEFDGVAQAVLSPDFSSRAISSIIDAARQSIYLNAYEITDRTLGDLLSSAVKRGVDVRILAEGEPVGGMQEPEFEILLALRGLGADVRVILDNQSLGVKARYRYDHAKYAVVDNRTLVVGSENWGPTGFPQSGRTGNRGWSVALDNAELSVFMADVFLEDWNPSRMDSVDILESEISAVPGEGEIDAAFDPVFSQEPINGHFHATPVIGPDAALDEDAVIGLIRSAENTLRVEQFYICTSWGAQSNLYLDEVVNAARRGVDVKVLLDSSWYNTDKNDTTDNDDTVALLNAISKGEGIPLAAKLGNSASHGLLKIHNKGLIIDGETVLVSSINWNLNSVTENREVGLIIENPDLASFFEDVFDFDWKDDVTPPFADAGDDFSIVEGVEAYLSAASSRDDVGIEAYLWDVDDDGLFELEGSLISWRWSIPGTYTVMLRVEDAWGNAASDWVNVTVTKQDPTHNGEGTSTQWLMIPFAVAMTSVIVLIVAIRRRK